MTWRLLAITWFLVPFLGYAIHRFNTWIYIAQDWNLFLKWVALGFATPLAWIVFYIPGIIGFIFADRLESWSLRSSSGFEESVKQLFAPKNIRVRLQDGRIGTINEKEFDPETMEKL